MLTCPCSLVVQALTRVRQDVAAGLKRLSKSSCSEASSRPHSLMDFANKLASICDEAANAYLHLEGVAQLEDLPIAPWVAEFRYWDGEGSTNPSGWVNEVTSAYLAEAAHQVRAVARLLEAEQVTAALDPLVRAVVERVGRVKLVLDPNITPRQRAIRAGVEIGVSYQKYGETLARLGAPSEDVKKQKTLRKAHRADLLKFFDVVRPLTDPNDESSSLSNEVEKWVIEGEAYPTYTAVAEAALMNDSSATSNKAAAAAYGGLAGFSHPSVVFSREHRKVSEEGRVTFVYLAKDLEHSTRMSAFVLLDGLRYWTTYYGADPEGVQRTVNELGDRLDTFSVLTG